MFEFISCSVDADNLCAVNGYYICFIAVSSRVDPMHVFSVPIYLVPSIGFRRPTDDDRSC